MIPGYALASSGLCLEMTQSHPSTLVKWPMLSSDPLSDSQMPPLLPVATDTCLASQALKMREAPLMSEEQTEEPAL